VHEDSDSEKEKDKTEVKQVHINTLAVRNEKLLDPKEQSIVNGSSVDDI
jgi:hypothetical protein